MGCKQSGGPKYRVELGRREGRKSKRKSVKGRLPMAGFYYKELRGIFAIQGLSEVDIIALLGFVLFFLSYLVYPVYKMIMTFFTLEYSIFFTTFLKKIRVIYN